MEMPQARRHLRLVAVVLHLKILTNHTHYLSRPSGQLVDNISMAGLTGSLSPTDPQRLAGNDAGVNTKTPPAVGGAGGVWEVSATRLDSDTRKLLAVDGFVNQPAERGRCRCYLARLGLRGFIRLNHAGAVLAFVPHDRPDLAVDP